MKESIAVFKSTSNEIATIWEIDKEMACASNLFHQINLCVEVRLKTIYVAFIRHDVLSVVLSVSLSPECDNTI